MVLAPLAVFFTYKANKDSTVFNMDAYRLLMMRMFGLRQNRSITRKEVIIETPVYAADSYYLLTIIKAVRQYNERHKLLKLPNPLKVFFKPGNDHEIEQISQQLEDVIEDLGNTRDRQIIDLLNKLPVLATHAHTRPFRQRWLNAMTGLILPLGIFFYCRMWRFRLRLWHDLKTIVQANETIANHINGS